jgi:cardiolipin synthase A/B
MRTQRALDSQWPGGTTDGNAATLFDDGARVLAAKSAAIRRATERVWVETFLFTPDDTGRAALDLLCDAARRGCDVILLFDQLGSHVTNLGFYRPLEDAGGRVAIFNPLPPWRRHGRRIGSFLRRRDHRKTVIADGIGCCGGHNFSDSYMGPAPQRFYDISVQLEGPCVSDLAAVFLDSFELATGDTRLPPAGLRAAGGGAAVRVRAQDQSRGMTGLVDEYEALLDGARKSAHFMMAYFTPDARLCAPLLRAAARGVDVSIVTAGSTDVPVTRWAGQHAYDALLDAGIRIYQLQHRKLHAKAAVIDGERQPGG